MSKKCSKYELILTSHLSWAYKTVFNMFSYNKKYLIHSEIIISTWGTGRSISSIFTYKTVITTILSRKTMHQFTSISHVLNDVKELKCTNPITIWISICFNNLFCHVSHLWALDLQRRIDWAQNYQAKSISRIDVSPSRFSKIDFQNRLNRE